MGGLGVFPMTPPDLKYPPQVPMSKRDLADVVNGAVVHVVHGDDHAVVEGGALPSMVCVELPCEARDERTIHRRS